MRNESFELNLLERISLVRRKLTALQQASRIELTKVNGLNLLKTRGTYFSDGNKVEAYGTTLTYFAFCTPFIFTTAGIKEDVEERYKLPG